MAELEAVVLSGPREAGGVGPCHCTLRPWGTQGSSNARSSRGPGTASRAGLRPCQALWQGRQSVVKSGHDVCRRGQGQQSTRPTLWVTFTFLWMRWSMLCIHNLAGITVHKPQISLISGLVSSFLINNEKTQSLPLEKQCLNLIDRKLTDPKHAH